MQRARINYVTSLDCGCEISDEEFRRFLQYVADELSENYPDAVIEVGSSVDAGPSRAHVSGTFLGGYTPDEHDVLSIAQDVWDCGDFWAPRSPPKPKGCVINFRVTDQEHEIFERAIKSSHLPRQVWWRAHGLAAAGEVDLARSVLPGVLKPAQADRPSPAALRSAAHELFVAAIDERRLAERVTMGAAAHREHADELEAVGIWLHQQSKEAMT